MFPNENSFDGLASVFQRWEILGLDVHLLTSFSPSQTMVMKVVFYYYFRHLSLLGKVLFPLRASGFVLSFWPFFSSGTNTVGSLRLFAIIHFTFHMA